jgi:hypothetical protein
MTPKTTTVASVGSPLLRTIDSTMPRATPVPNATGSDSIRATTAAARAGSSETGPWVTDTFTPANGARSMNVRVARPPETAHTIVDSRRMGMPSSSARSAFSAAARTATPASVRSRNQARPAITTGTTAMMRIWSPNSDVSPMLWRMLIGTSKAP